MRGHPTQILPPRLGLNYQLPSDINLSTCLVPWTYLNHHDVLRDLVSIVQLKKREKHPWVSVSFSKVACFYLCY